MEKEVKLKLELPDLILFDICAHNRRKIELQKKINAWKARNARWFIQKEQIEWRTKRFNFDESTYTVTAEMF